MSAYEDRVKQFEEVDVPAARLHHVANGIRKKFADQFDFGGMSDQDVINRHHARFGAEMDPIEYDKKLEEVYGKDFQEPTKPEMTLGDKVAQVGETAKDIGKGIVPFVVPELGKAGALAAGAKAVATKIPVAAQIGFASAHAINAAVDQGAVQNLEAAKESLPVPDVAAKTQEFYAKLQPGLAQKGYTDEQIMDEARNRAENVAAGYAKTTQSIDDQVAQTQRDIVLEPAKAATDAVFLGLGGPAVEGMLQKGLARVGLDAVGRAATKGGAGAVAGRLAEHAIRGAAVGGPGMALQEGCDRAVLAAAENKPIQEVGSELVKGAEHGFATGAKFGAGLGAGLGLVGEVAAAPVERAARKKYLVSQAEVEADQARLNGWRTHNEQAAAQTRATAEKSAADRIAAIEKTADNFNPHLTTVPPGADAAETATTIIQQQHGDAAAMSEAGLRAASKIEAKLRLFQDANAEVQRHGERALPEPTEPVLSEGTNVSLGPLEQAGQERLPAPQTMEGFKPEQRNLPPAGPGAPSAESMPTEIREPLPPVKEQPKLELAPQGQTEPPLQIERPTVVRPGGPAPRAIEPAPRLRPAIREDGKVYVGKTHGDIVNEHNLTGDMEDGFVDKEGKFLSREEADQAITGGKIGTMHSAWLPKEADIAISKMDLKNHAVVTAGENGEINLEKLGTPKGQNTPGGVAAALQEITRRADEHKLPVVTRITQVPGPKGGQIPIEKQLPWYEKHGFKLVDSTKLPEGQMATATLRREPVSKKLSIEEAKARAFEKLAGQPITGRQRGQIVGRVKDLTRGEADKLLRRLQKGEL